jgi:hypothetical protein
LHFRKLALPGVHHALDRNKKRGRGATEVAVVGAVELETAVGIEGNTD